MIPSLYEFIAMSAEGIAAQVREKGLKVCVFAVNGTRRWFRLEYPESGDDIGAYFSAMVDVHVRLCQLLFEHGIETLVMPVFGPELLNRAGYLEVAHEGLHILATHPKILNFYDSADIRVRFYGDYRELFKDARWNGLLDSFSELAVRTANHKRGRLFLGACAQDATAAIVKTTIEYYKQYHGEPSREDLTRLYYGEPVEPANIFIGFDCFYAFDMPLLDVGETALYFTVCPSPYLTTTQLREILYDYLYMREASFMTDPMKLSEESLRNMSNFYRINRRQTQGIGFLMDGIWYPTSHVVEPPGIPKQPPLPTTGELRYLTPRQEMKPDVE